MMVMMKEAAPISTVTDQRKRQIVIFTPGESAAAPYTGYLTERALTGKLAAAIGGATILVERRYSLSSMQRMDGRSSDAPDR